MTNMTNMTNRTNSDRVGCGGYIENRKWWILMSLRKALTAAGVAVFVTFSGVQAAGATEYAPAESSSINVYTVAAGEESKRVPEEENRIIADPISRWMPDQGEGNHEFRPLPRIFYYPPLSWWYVEIGG